MKQQKISGNKAASPETTTSSPVVSKSAQQQLPLPPTQEQLLFDDVSQCASEPYVTKAYISDRFDMSYSTIQRNVRDGMPAHFIGKRGVRYIVSEIQRWLDKNGRKRFAATGRAATRRELQKRIAIIPILEGLEVVDGQRSPPKSNVPEATSSPQRELLVPKCKPGRKPKHHGQNACEGRHKWRTSQYTRTCARCGRVEERDATNNWIASA